MSKTKLVTEHILTVEELRRRLGCFGMMLFFASIAFLGILGMTEQYKTFENTCPVSLGDVFTLLVMLVFVIGMFLVAIIFGIDTFVNNSEPTTIKVRREVNEN